MREMWGCGGQWARPTDRDREATKAVGIIAHQANRREQVMAKELKDMSVEELVFEAWEEGLADAVEVGGFDEINAITAELTRRITEANARADRLAAEGKIPNGHVMLPGGEVVKVLGELPITADRSIAGIHAEVYVNTLSGTQSGFVNPHVLLSTGDRQDGWHISASYATREAAIKNAKGSK